MPRARQGVKVAHDEILSRRDSIPQQSQDHVVHGRRVEHMPRQCQQQQNKGEKRQQRVGRHGECKSMHFRPHEVEDRMPSQFQTASGMGRHGHSSGGWLGRRCFRKGFDGFHGPILAKPRGWAAMREIRLGLSERFWFEFSPNE